MILCADGQSGLKEAVITAFPATEYQGCIVHQVRNTLKYEADKDKKKIAADLKNIYQTRSEVVAHKRMLEVTKKWDVYFPRDMKSWSINWDVTSPIFKFSSDERKVICTINIFGTFITLTEPRIKHISS